MAKRRDRKRRKAQRQTAVSAEGVRGALEVDPHHFRRDCRTLASYMEQGGTFTQDEIRLMTRRVGEIVSRSDSERNQIAAFKVLQAGAKLSHDIETAKQPAKVAHAHLHAAAQSSGRSVFDVARDLGIEVDPKFINGEWEQEQGGGSN